MANPTPPFNNNLRGPIGLPGPVGKQGIKGDKGDRGVVGPKGDKGERGDKGDIGRSGTQGIKGDAGSDGGMQDPGNNGILVRIADNTTVARTIEAGNATVLITNGNGVAGDPTITGNYQAGSGITITGNIITSTAGGGTVTSVAGAGPIVIAGTPTVNPTVTIQGSIVSGAVITTAQNLGLLTTGLLKGTVSGGINTISAAIAGTDFQPPGAYITALTGDVVATGPGSVAATISNHAVTYIKMQQGSANVLIGNPTGSLANLSEITLGAGLSFVGSALTATNAGTVTNVTGTAPITSTGGSTPAIGINTDSTLAVVSSLLGRAAISGDGTISAGSNIFALSNIPSGTTAAGSILFTDIVAPGTPAAGKASVYIDSTSLNFAVKNASGIINHGIQSNAGTIHEWVSAINNDGTVVLTQPAYSDLSGAPPAITALTGDVIATGPGSVPATISANAVTNAKFRQSSAFSVVGNPTGSTANVQDISAGTDGLFLGRSAGTLSWQTVPGASVRADGILTGTIQLSTLASATLTDGTIAYVDTVDDFFKLQNTSFSVDNITVVAASGKAGWQWVRLGINSIKWYAATTWYVDPVSGNDENAGTVGVPLKTYLELSRRLNGRNVTTGITLNILSDATDTDILSVNLATATSISINGIETVLTSGTVSAHVAPVYVSGNVQNQITIGSFNWAPYVGNLIRKSGASGGAGVYASVIADLGSGSAIIAPASLNSNPSFVSYFQTGDVVQILGVTKAPKIQVSNVSLVSASFSGLYNTSTTYSAAANGLATFSLSFCTVGVGSNNSVNFSTRSLTMNVCSVKNSLSSNQGVTLNTVAFIGTSPTYSFGSTGGTNITISDCTFYPTSPSAANPVVALGPSSSVIMQTRTSPGIGNSFFNLAAGGVGLALGNNSTLQASSIYGANNSGSSWVLAWPIGTRIQIATASLQSTFYETSSAGVKVDWNGSSITANGTTIPNIQAGYGPNFMDRWSSGRGPNIASSSRLFPGGLLTYRMWTVTGTNTVNTMTIFPQANGVSILNDGALVELEIKDGLTITNNATPTAFVDAKFVLANGVDAVLPAGSHITFRFDLIYGGGQGVWTEVSRDSATAVSIIGNPTGSPALQKPITSTGNNLFLGSNGTNTALAFSTIPATSITGLPSAITALTGDVTATGPGSVAATISVNAVTYAKFQQAGAHTLIGNPTGSTANVSEITLGAGLSFSGTTLTATGTGGTITAVTASSPLFSSGGSTPNLTIQGAFVSGSSSTTAQNLGSLTTGLLKGTVSGSINTISTAISGTDYQPPGSYITALTGDVTATGPGSVAATISVNAVTNTKFRQSAALSVVGNGTNATANIADISAISASGAVLRESGSTIGFGTIATAGLGNNIVTYAKIQQVSAVSLLGNPSGSTANVSEITLGAGLSFSGSTIICTVSGGGGGTVTAVTGTAPMFVSNPTTTPNVTIQGSIVSGSTSTTAQNLGALNNGTLQQTISGSIATISAFNGATGSIPFYVGSGQLDQNNGNFFWDNTNERLGIGTSTPNYTLDVNTNNTQIHFGIGDNGGYLVSTAASQGIIAGGASFNGSAWIAKATQASITSMGSGLVSFTTNTGLTPGSSFGPTTRMQIDTSGNVSINNLSAGGLVKAAVTTGLLGIAAAGTDYQTPISAGPGINLTVSGTQINLGSVGAPTAPIIAEFGGIAPNAATAANMQAVYQWDLINITLTGSTHVTGNGLGLINFQAPIVRDTSAVTVDFASTVAISGSPTSSGSVTLSNSYALWVQGGTTRIDGTLQFREQSGPDLLTVEGIPDAAPYNNVLCRDSVHTNSIIGIPSNLLVAPFKQSATYDYNWYNLAPGSGVGFNYPAITGQPNAAASGFTVFEYCPGFTSNFMRLVVSIPSGGNDLGPPATSMSFVITRNGSTVTTVTVPTGLSVFGVFDSGQISVSGSAVTDTWGLTFQTGFTVGGAFTGNATLRIYQ